MTSMVEELRGACHCGRVRVTIPAASAGVVVCHCADCQKLHGSSFALFAAERSSVRWEGEEHIRWYHSSPANERSFCGHCGSRLAKRPVDGTRVLVSAGLFEHTLARKATKNLWAEQKPAWVEAPRVGPMTPEEFVALAFAEPIGTETARYGYSLRATAGNKRPPGVIALTWIAGKNAAERVHLHRHGVHGAAGLHGDGLGGRGVADAGALQAPRGRHEGALRRGFRRFGVDERVDAKPNQPDLGALPGVRIPRGRE